MPGYLSPVSLRGLVEGTLATMFEVTAIVNWSVLVGAVCDSASVACCIPSDTIHMLVWLLTHCLQLVRSHRHQM